MGNEPQWRRLLRDGQLQDDSPCRNETTGISHTLQSPPRTQGARPPTPPAGVVRSSQAEDTMRLCICAGVGGEANLPQIHTKSPPHYICRAPIPTPQQPWWAEVSEVPVAPHPAASKCLSMLPQHPASPRGSDIPKAPTRLLNLTRDHHCTEGGNPPGTRTCPKGDPKHPVCTHSILGAEPRCGTLADPPPGLTSARGCCGTPSCSTGGHHQRGPGCASMGARGAAPGLGNC